MVSCLIAIYLDRVNVSCIQAIVFSSGTQYNPTKALRLLISLLSTIFCHVAVDFSIRLCLVCLVNYSISMSIHYTVLHPSKSMHTELALTWFRKRWKNSIFFSCFLFVVIIISIVKRSNNNSFLVKSLPVFPGEPTYSKLNQSIHYKHI